MLVRIRTAVAGDVPALRREFSRSWLANAQDREILRANPQALELTDSGVTERKGPKVAVAADGTIVGFATGLTREGSRLELEDLFVDPDWTRRGIAHRPWQD